MISMKIKKMSKKDDHVMETKIQREKFGTTIDDILAEEAKKFDLSIEEFLESPKTAKRLQEVLQVLELMEQKEYREFNTVSAGAPGLGKHKS